MSFNIMANTLLQHMRVIININASMTLLTMDVDSSDKVDGNEPQKAKITTPKSFQSDKRTNRKK